MKFIKTKISQIPKKETLQTKTCKRELVEKAKVRENVGKAICYDCFGGNIKRRMKEKRKTCIQKFKIPFDSLMHTYFHKRMQKCTLYPSLLVYIASRILITHSFTRIAPSCFSSYFCSRAQSSEQSYCDFKKCMCRVHIGNGDRNGRI